MASVPPNDPAARLLLRVAPSDLEKFWDVLTNIPVPVGVVADRLGIEVLSTTLDPNISGLIKRKQDGSFEIQVNDLDSPVRQRFTVCHEIGHFLLHRKLIDAVGIQDNILYRSNLSSLQESEANRIAAAILLPWETVQGWHHANFAGPVKKENLKAIATHFKASDLAVGYRFGI